MATRPEETSTKIDFIQEILESKLLNLGYYYDRPHSVGWWVGLYHEWAGSFASMLVSENLLLFDQVLASS